jgi:ribosomal protein L14E/L6E/L27E
MGSESQIIGPMYIDDVTKQIKKIAYRKNMDEKVQLVPIKIYTVKDYLNEIQKLHGFDLDVKWNARKTTRKEITEFPKLKNGILMQESQVTLDAGIKLVLSQY